MPLINFVCNNPECENCIEHFYAKRKDIPTYLDCFCGGKLERTLGAPSSMSKVSIDNGVQAKAVEIVDRWHEIKDRQD